MNAKEANEKAKEVADEKRILSEVAFRSVLNRINQSISNAAAQGEFNVLFDLNGFTPDELALERHHDVVNHLKTEGYAINVVRTMDGKITRYPTLIDICWSNL